MTVRQRLPRRGRCLTSAGRTPKTPIVMTRVLPQSERPAVPRPRARSPLAVLVGLACLMSHLGGLLHLILVPHATCAEHGETSHLVPDTTPHADEARGDGWQLGTDAQPEGEDDHCLTVALTRAEAASLHAPADAVPVVHALARPVAVPAQQPACPLPLLAFAPKTSPPALPLI